MTITELAKELGVTRQTIYNKCKTNGIVIDTLTKEKQGTAKQLTNDGVFVIRKLFDVERQMSKNTLQTGQQTEQRTEQQRQRIAELEKKITELRRESAEIRRENVELKRDNAEQAKKISALEMERIRLVMQLDTKDKQIQAANVLAAQAQQTVLNITNRGGGLFGWLKRLRLGAGSPAAAAPEITHQDTGDTSTTSSSAAGK